MSKKQKKSPLLPQPVIAETAAHPPAESDINESRPVSILDFKVQAIIVVLLGFIFYINTFSNEFAHDDGIVIVKNEYVQAGFAGIPKIFTKDAYDSYYRQLNTTNQLAGGRYRPLSIATFAIEQQFFGAVPEEKMDSFLKQNLTYGVSGDAQKKLHRDMHIRHLFNVFWYMAALVALLYFLRKIVFKDQPLMALVATIIFAIHPIHTEVVANVKSRDEIMSLLFMCLTFILAFKYEEEKKYGILIGAMLSLFLAFLSKEYAITIFALLPLSFYLFKNYTIPQSLKATLPYLLIFIVYIFVRVKVAAGGDGSSSQSLYDVIQTMTSKNENADKEVLNNPYYYATPVQKVATEISTSLNYIKLLIFPEPLSADYSYNSIPYKDFSNFQVWFSIFVHLLLAGLMVFFIFVRKNLRIIGFALAFYLLHLLLINNLIFNIGATMGERLIFHSSVGFAIIVAYLLCKGVENIQPYKSAMTTLAVVLCALTVLCGFKTISRNTYWKNDKTLFTEDIKVVPNSVLVNGNVAASYISMADYDTSQVKKKEYLHKAIGLLNNAIAIHPQFVAGFLNKGIAYYKLGELDSAKICLDSVQKNYPNYPTLSSLFTLLADYHMRNGWNNYGKIGKYPEAIAEFKVGLAIDSNNVELWYNLGGAYYSSGQLVEAINAWQRALKLKPDHEQARQGMQAAMINLQQNQGHNPAPPTGAQQVKAQSSTKKN